MTRLTTFGAVVTLSKEPCEVIRGVLRAKSDGRIVYRQAKVLIDAGFITEEGKVTPWLQERIDLGCT